MTVLQHTIYFHVNEVFNREFSVHKSNPCEPKTSVWCQSERIIPNMVTPGHTHLLFIFFFFFREAVRLPPPPSCVTDYLGYPSVARCWRVSTLVASGFHLCSLQMMWFRWLHWGFRFSTSKTKTIVLRDKVECLVQVRNELLPQVEEFKYVEVFSTVTGE